jgi:MFS family permease
MLFVVSRVTAVLGVQIQSVALGWQVYAVARQTMPVAQAAFYVGMIGLVSFIPVFLLALPAGEAADRYDRKVILLLSFAGEVATAAVLAAASIFGFASLPLLLGMACVFGATRAFMAPAQTALGPMLVPRTLLPRAIAWNALSFQASAIAGPALGGVLVAISPGVSYSASAGLYLASLLAMALVRGVTRPATQPGSRW